MGIEFDPVPRNRRPTRQGGKIAPISGADIEAAARTWETEDRAIADIEDIEVEERLLLGANTAPGAERILSGERAVARRLNR
ncbi:MAG: hypothetical protein MPW14_05820 [Candidatus Manganitrophus sp.]|nr:MAG: hypothetical protein MPW14_05820 [Candidatus Manganitrophus sp.]